MFTDNSRLEINFFMAFVNKKIQNNQIFDSAFFVFFMLAEEKLTRGNEPGSKV